MEGSVSQIVSLAKEVKNIKSNFCHDLNIVNNLTNFSDESFFELVQRVN